MQRADPDRDVRRHGERLHREGVGRAVRVRAHDPSALPRGDLARRDHVVDLGRQRRRGDVRRDRQLGAHRRRSGGVAPLAGRLGACRGLRAGRGGGGTGPTRLEQEGQGHQDGGGRPAGRGLAHEFLRGRGWSADGNGSGEGRLDHDARPADRALRVGPGARDGRHERRGFLLESTIAVLGGAAIGSFGARLLHRRSRKEQPARPGRAACAMPPAPRVELCRAQARDKRGSLSSVRRPAMPDRRPPPVTRAECYH